MAIPAGARSSAAVAGPPSPVSPAARPRCRPRCRCRRRSWTGPTGCRWRRRSRGSGCSARSAMYRSPEASRATWSGPFRVAAVAGPPSPLLPGGAGGAAGDGVDVAGGHGLAPLGAGGGGDFLDPVVGRVGDVDVAGRVDGHADRVVEQRRGGGAAVAGGAARAGRAARRCRRCRRRSSRRRCVARDLVDLGVDAVGDEHVAGGVDRDPSGKASSRRRWPGRRCRTGRWCRQPSRRWWRWSRCRRRPSGSGCCWCRRCTGSRPGRPRRPPGWTAGRRSPGRRRR